MPRHELDLQKKIVAKIVLMGGEARICTQTPYTTIGDPDVYGCLNGAMIQWEVKDGDAYGLQGIQKHRLQGWWGAGAWAYKVKTMEEAELLLNAITADSRPGHRVPYNKDFSPSKSPRYRT